MPGDDSGDLPPAGLTWAEYIGRWVTDCGGWVELADRLIDRAGEAVEIAGDAQTVERGLRRLASRGHKPGGQYGRWMVRYFGFTRTVEEWVRWLGRYHTRFADLPCGLRLEQLALWNRPPVAESPLASWLHVGIASAHYSRLDLAACDHWLGRAERLAAAAGHAAELEVGLVRAQLEADTGAHAAAVKRCAAIEARLISAELSAIDQICYRTRLLDQRAALWARPPAGQPVDLARARACYEAIPDSVLPFVAFRKSVGLAYCAWKLGDVDAAVRLAHRAIEEAGDGGLVRMRVMALNMLSRVLPADQAAPVHERARRMASSLQDEDLLRRVSQCAP